MDDHYQPLAAGLMDDEGMVRSEVLGLGLRAENELIRFRNLATGEDVLHRDETEAERAREAALRKTAEARAEREAARAEREAARARREAAARSAAEARVAELEAGRRR